MRMMSLLVFITAAVLLSAGSASAAINPIYRCTSRGYNLSGGFCELPNSSRCPEQDFALGRCGAEFTRECVKEGRYVWTSLGDRCCEGLAPYLPAPVGQPTCQSVSLSGTASPGPTASPRSPGFGLPLALAALAGAGLVRRRFAS